MLRASLDGRELAISLLEIESIKDQCLLSSGDPLEQFAAVYEITLSEAWQIWNATGWIADYHSRENKIRAEVAYHYKIDAFKMSEIEVLALRGNLPKLRARQRIEMGKYDPLDHESIYRLFLDAYDDEDLARKRQAESFAMYVEAKTKK